ncbi:cytochrome P450 71A1-like protein [Corchorus olitorius]|uniref:Cytochrome P450 71A1-like protein n=1 Tax=Corchorus olitorius TaxID=93759 RepID=A0A1R3IKH2_9ROSI|nr:cytochrome P450 71A1-like protein [Corchorus olitorius]
MTPSALALLGLILLGTISAFFYISQHHQKWPETSTGSPRPTNNWQPPYARHSTSPNASKVEQFAPVRKAELGSLVETLKKAAAAGETVDLSQKAGISKKA